MSVFVPRHYREPDHSWMVDLIRTNPLALLVINGADGPIATHLPVIPDPHAASWSPERPGAVLLGHMNRTNPHWSRLSEGNSVLLTFMGPSGYVSPSVHATTPSAPTWNFTAVHVRGVLTKVRSAEETLSVVQATVQALEAVSGTGWDMSSSIDYFRRLLPGVGAFRVTVTRADGMFKLSQDQPPEVRDRVRRAFARRDSANHRALADLMGRLTPRPLVED